MSRELDLIWGSYRRTCEALLVLRRVVSEPTLANHSLVALKGTNFANLATAAADTLIAEMQDQLDDQVVLALYAAFESELRDHLVAQSKHLTANATKPDAAFAKALGELYEEWCDDGVKMDKVASLFSNALAGTNLVAQAGQVRRYRNWVGHGKRGAKPPQTTPAFAYQVLAAFLAGI